MAHIRNQKKGRQYGPPKTTKTCLLPKHYKKLIKDEIVGLGSGDTSIHLNVFEEDMARMYFNEMLESYNRMNINNMSTEGRCGGSVVIDADNNNDDFACDWEEMFNFGKPVARLVCVQAEPNDDGSMPMYRHPIDVHPKCRCGFSQVVGEIIQEARLKFTQNFNHALIQLYRSGEDNISLHTDKTLDIEPGSSIVNVSFGASREFIIRSKAKLKHGKGVEQMECIALPHNSMLCLGLETNRLFTHQVHQDIRKYGQKREDEVSFNGIRISLTLRVISTFLRKDGKLYGQGAKHKTLKALKRSEFDLLEKTQNKGLIVTHCRVPNVDSIIDVNANLHREGGVSASNKSEGEEEEVHVGNEDTIFANMQPIDDRGEAERCDMTAHHHSSLPPLSMNSNPSQLLSSLWPISSISSKLMQYPSLVEYDNLSKAFQSENRDGDSFDWHAKYGQGFDVLDKEDALKKSGLTLKEAIELAFQST